MLWLGIGWRGADLERDVGDEKEKTYTERDREVLEMHRSQLPSCPVRALIFFSIFQDKIVMILS